MPRTTRGPSRRSFLKASATAAAGILIVPRHVVGGPGTTPPSETFGGGLIGCGGRSGGTFGELSKNLNVVKLADCDVKFLDKADNKKVYTDFRRVLDRKDIDLIAIATPPHWHGLISIAAAEAGKDVLCEKPMTRTIGEARAVAEAFRRYKRIFQIGTFGRFGMAGNKDNVLTRKIMTSGLLKECKGVLLRKGGFKVKEWSGRLDVPEAPIPKNLDWDMYCGPSPLKPFVPPRHGGTHRWYWDYENGGLGDMGQHAMDPVTWLFGLDVTAPVEVETYAPPAHPEVAGMWGWSKLKYANGFTLVLESGEWGEPSGMKSVPVTINDLDEESQKKLKEMPDPPPLLSFAEAVKQRKPAGGNADAAYRTVTLLHLTNISIRTGRKLKYDPVTDQVIGDEEANRLAHQVMRGALAPVMEKHMATLDEIKKLVESMPDLDGTAKTPAAEPTTKPKRDDHAGERGKLTGPTWADAAKVYDQILAGGKESVTMVIDLIPEPDTGNAYKARYVLHGMAIYVCRPEKQQQRAALIEAVSAQVGGSKSKQMRGLMVRTLQAAGDKSAIPAIVPLLSDEELCDPAAQALVTLNGGDALRAALPAAKGRAKLAIVQALGGVRDSSAVEGLLAAANDADTAVKLAALWGLARLAVPQAADVAIKATALEGYDGIKARQLAILLADNLATTNQKAAATKIYQYIKEKFTDPKDAYIREAAEEGLGKLK